MTTRSKTRAAEILEPKQPQPKSKPKEPKRGRGCCNLFCGVELRPYNEDEIWEAYVSDIYLDKERGIYEVEPLFVSKKRLERALKPHAVKCYDMEFEAPTPEGTRYCTFDFEWMHEADWGMKKMGLNAYTSMGLPNLPNGRVASK